MYREDSDIFEREIKIEKINALSFKDLIYMRNRMCFVLERMDIPFDIACKFYEEIIEQVVDKYIEKVMKKDKED